MTVSPQWPDEGSRPPQQPASGRETDDSYRTNALPPTLFQLPNLNVDRTTAGGSPTPSDTTDEHRSAATPPPMGAGVVGQVPFVPGNSETPHSAQSEPCAAHIDRLADNPTAAAHPAAPVDDSDDLPPTFPTPPAVTHSTQTPATMGRRTDSVRRAPVSSDMPAGRSWMDSIGSHGIVVVLLLVVVAAALITGRNAADNGPDGNLAESTEWLDFDEGSDVQLPLPASVIEPTSTSDITSLVESMGLANEESSIAEAATPQGQNAAIENTTSLGIPEPQAGFAPDSLADNCSGQTGSTLDVPADEYFDPPMPQPTAAASSKVQFNEYVSGPTSIDVMTAANRVPIGDDKSVLPSLEELAGETTDFHATPSESSVTPTGPIRIRTSTPNGIVDWSKHLPAPEPTTTTATLPSNIK